MLFTIFRLNERSIVYSFGLGTDITFDKALIQRYNLHVYGFDNTPIASRYLEKTTLPPNFHWVKYVLRRSAWTISGFRFSVFGVANVLGIVDIT